MLIHESFSVVFKIQRVRRGHRLWRMVCSIGGVDPPLSPMLAYGVLTSLIINVDRLNGSDCLSIFDWLLSPATRADHFGKEYIQL